MYLTARRGAVNLVGKGVFCLLLLLMTGCAGSSGNVSEKPVFFPPPPNLPRVQLLTTLSDSRDIEGEESNFSLIGKLSEKTRKTRFIVKPYGVLSRGGKLYVCDAGSAQVIVIDFAAETFRYLKGAHGYGALKKPVNMDVAPDGKIYVADTGRGEVVVYGADQEYEGAFGAEYAMRPVDVLADENFLYVLDLENSDIKILERSEGKLVKKIGREEGTGKGLALPVNMTMDDGRIFYVTNLYTGNVAKLDRDGHFLESFGKLGDGFGQFGRPRGIDIDEQGRIYVSDASHQNVQVFRNDGRLLMFFSERDGRPLNLPADVSVTSDNLEYFQKMAAPGFDVEQLVFVSTQYGAKKIYVYGLGRKQGIDYEKAYRELQEKREEMASRAREKLEKEEKRRAEKTERE